MRFVYAAACLLLALGLTGCNLGSTEPTEAPTETPTETVEPSITPTPSATASPTITLTPSATFTPSNTPTATHTATATFTPTATPEAVAQLISDNSRLLDIPVSIRSGLNSPYVAYLVANDRSTVTNLSTAQPENDLVTLYYASPNNPAGRVPIVEVRTLVNNQFFVSPDGSAIIYLVVDPLGLTSGLYVADVSVGISARISTINSLTQRNRFSAPAFAPDGRQAAVAIATGYDLDIFIYDLTQGKWFNLTNDGAYDWAPVWSPDGRYIAFLSDRLICTSWIPGDGGCVAGIDTPSPAGHVFVYDLQTGVVKQVSDEAVVEPPRWVTNNLISYAVTDYTNILSAERGLMVANINADSAASVRLRGDTGQTIYTGESYSDDGRYVILQNNSLTGNSQVVLMTIDGDPIASTQDLAFSRSGMVASWSPDGTRIVLGGVAGQCPHGRVMVDAAQTIATGRFVYLAAPNPPNPTSMCEPIFSANGVFAALTGVSRPSTAAPDGRSDVFVVNNNGYGQQNMTGTLRGSATLIGWVGG